MLVLQLENKRLIDIC